VSPFIARPPYRLGAAFDPFFERRAALIRQAVIVLDHIHTAQGELIGKISKFAA
jgi:hypothetical protein